MVAVWARDPSDEVRRAAVLASADLSNREPITTASTDGSPELRRTAAYAVGFAQDPRLRSILDKLLQDPIADARNAAALSLLSYPVDQAAGDESDPRLGLPTAVCQRARVRRSRAIRTNAC